MEKSDEDEQQKLWDGTDCQFPFLSFIILVFQLAEKHIAICKSLAKLGRQKAYQEDYIFKKCRKESISCESKKYACI